jgi:cytochrome c556
MDDSNENDETTNIIEDAEVVENTEDPTSPVVEDPEAFNTTESEEEVQTDVEATEEPAEPTHATPNAIQSLLNVESMINRYIADIEKLQEKMKTQRDMFNDAFNNDAEYSQIMQKVKEVNRLKQGAKQRIMKLPAVAEAKNKLDEYKDEMKEMQDALSSYLQQYRQLSGTNQITSETGEIREIIVVTKLVKKGKYRP